MMKNLLRTTCKFATLSLLAGIALPASAVVVVPASVDPAGGTDASGFINTINGDGLASPLATGDPEPGTYPQHIIPDSSDSTLPSLEEVVGRVGGSTLGPIDYELGGIYNLSGAVIWNYAERFNAEYLNDRGINAFSLSYSSDNGATYGTPQNFTATQVPTPGSTTGTFFFDPETFATAGANNVTHVRLNASSNFGGNLIGFSEIVFTGSFVADAKIRLDINRDTGNATLRNNTPSAVNLAGLSVLSGAGALIPGNYNSIHDNYDQGAAGGISNDEWLEFLETDSELSEGTLGVGTLAAGQSINLGNIWQQFPNEEVAIEYLDPNTGATVQANVVYSGVTQTTPFEFGDYNLDGNIDELDWPTQRDNYRADLSGLSNVGAYNRGDFDLDGDNDIDDILAFQAAYVAAGNPLSALTAVPEPASILLLAMAGILMGGRRLRHAALSIAPVLALVVGLTVNSAAYADSIGVNFTESTGHTNQQIAPTTTVGSGLLTPTLNWNNVADANGSAVPLNDDTGAASGASVTWASGGTWGDGSADADATAGVGDAQLLRGYLDDGGSGVSIDLAGIPYSQYSILLVGSTDTNGSNYHDATINGLTYSTTGTKDQYGTNPALDATRVWVAPGLSGSSASITLPARNGAVRGSVAGFQILEDTGAPLFLTLEINSNTGAGFLKNETAAPVDLNFYEISSTPSASLEFANWNSLQDQDYEGNGAPGTGNGWEELGSNGGVGDNYLAEFYLDSSSVLPTGASIPLGAIFDTTNGVEGDVAFRYRDLDLGANVNGIVKFVTGGPINGDYDDDGLVGQGDLDLVLLNWGDTAPPVPNGWVNQQPSGLIGQTQLDGVLLNWGNTALNAPVASAVPEPASLALVCFGIGGLGLMCRRRS